MIGVHKQTYAPPEKDALPEKDAPPEKMRRRAVKFWRERCPSVRRRKRFIRGVLFPSGCLYRGLGKTGRGMKSLGPGAGAVHGTD